MACNFCRCSAYKIISDQIRFEKKRVLQCENCGLVYLEMMDGKVEIELFYSAQYRKLPTRPILTEDNLYYHKVTQQDASDRIEFLMSHMDIQDKCVLEIGSASGNLLEKMLECGAKDAIGVELDAKLSAYTRQRGIKVHTRPLEALGFKNEFDAIISFHVLEHVYNPKTVIRAVYSGLKPGGLFLGEVPNQDDWRIKIFDDQIVKQFHYEPSHYYYYSPVTLRNYLEHCGFGDIRFETVERYNSLLQLKKILCGRYSEKTIKEILDEQLFPKSEKDDVRLPNVDDPIETEFNRLFGNGVNSELMGNCLRWAARK